MSVVLGWDSETLREKVDLMAVGERLRELGDMRSLAALNEKVSLLRMAEQLDEALRTANQALTQARFTGDRETAARARIRRAAVLHYQGKLTEAITEFSDVVSESGTHEWRRTEAYARQHRAKALFEQGDLEAAAADLRTTADIRRRLQVPDDELESTLFALEVVEAKLDERRRSGYVAPEAPTTARTGPDAARREHPDAGVL